MGCQPIATIARMSLWAIALQRQTADDLKDLAAPIFLAHKPIRKDDLVAFIQKYLEGQNLRASMEEALKRYQRRWQ